MEKEKLRQIVLMLRDLSYEIQSMPASDRQCPHC